MPLSLPPELIGLRVSGDLAGNTIYTTQKGRFVEYKAAPARKPPSPLQTAQRTAFVRSIRSWRSLAEADRELYEQASLLMNLCMTGLNLWIHIQLRGGPAAWETACQVSRLPLPRPPRLLL